MGTFDEEIETVKELVEEFGELITFKRLSYTVSDPDKPWIQTEIPGTQKDLKIIFLSPGASASTLFGRELLQYLKGSQTITGEVRGYMASGSIVPKQNDIVIRKGKELKISAIDILNPNGQDILYTLEFYL
jgi:hypothetical protein